MATLVETGRKFAVNRPKMGEKYQKWLTMTKSWKLKMVENGRKWSENYRKLREMADNEQKITEMAENGPTWPRKWSENMPKMADHNQRMT